MPTAMPGMPGMTGPVAGMWTPEMGIRFGGPSPALSGNVVGQGGGEQESGNASPGFPPGEEPRKVKRTWDPTFGMRFS